MSSVPINEVPRTSRLSSASQHFADPAAAQTTPTLQHNSQNSSESDSRAARSGPASRNVLIVAPSLDSGAADAGAAEIARVLAAAGHHPIVAAPAGRLVSDITASGGEFIALDTAAQNPASMLRAATRLTRIIRERQCVSVHALGRAPAWSAYIAARVTHTPLMTSWFKGFREQNILKRLYNRIMVSGCRISTVSTQLADLVHDRYGTPRERIAVVPLSIDLDRFDPANVDAARIAAVRNSWGVAPDTRIILVTGRILRRKGHNTVVKATRRLKQRGLKNFLIVFVGEDRGRTRYTGELWDLVVSSGTVDVVRMAAPVADMPAAYAAASVVVSAANQPEGLQRALLEAQAMARPVIVSDLAAGADVVLSDPTIAADRASGLRFPAGDDAALAASLLQLFAMTEADRHALGRRGREWVTSHFGADTVSDRVLALYSDATAGAIAPPGARSGR